MSCKISLSTLAALVLFFAGEPSYSQVHPEIGIRGNVMFGDGTPANDIQGAGVIGKIYYSSGWYLSGTLDVYDYDFERPTSLVAIQPSSGTDAVASKVRSTVLGAAFGRHYGERSGFDWFWSAGVGVGVPNARSIAGTAQNGSPYFLEIDARTEIHLMGTLGTTYNWTDKWSITGAARAEHHFLDINVTDRMSQIAADVRRQSPIGAYWSLNYKF